MNTGRPAYDRVPCAASTMPLRCSTRPSSVSSTYSIFGPFFWHVVICLCAAFLYLIFSHFIYSCVSPSWLACFIYCGEFFYCCYVIKISTLLSNYRRSAWGVNQPWDSAPGSLLYRLVLASPASHRHVIWKTDTFCRVFVIFSPNAYLLGYFICSHILLWDEALFCSFLLTMGLQWPSLDTRETSFIA